MPKQAFPIVGGSNQEISEYLDGERTINWYPYTSPKTKKKMLAPTSGTELIDTLNTGDSNARGRRSFAGDDEALDYMFEVVGNKAFKVDSNLTKSIIGTLNTSEGYVGICSNGTYVLFADGSKAYAYKIATDDFTELSFPLNPRDCTFIDGFFFLIISDTNLVYQSAIDDPLEWDVENFEHSNANGDLLVACRSLGDRLWLQSSESISVWENQGKAGFAFRQDKTMLYDFGVLSPYTVSVSEGTMFFLSRTSTGVGSVYMTNGGRPRPVSTPAINYQISKIADKSDAQGFAFKENGQIFYQLSFTAGNRTFVYSVQEDEWFERMMSDRSRHIACSYAFFNGQPYILSYADNKLYRMAQDLITDNGTPIYRRRTCAPFENPEDNNIFVTDFEPDFRPGVGLNGTPNFYSPNYIQGANPAAYLSISRNGGITFGNQHKSYIGRMGNFNKRTVFRRLGRAGPKGKLVFTIEVFDPVAPYLLDGSIRYELTSNSGR